MATGGGPTGMWTTRPPFVPLVNSQSTGMSFTMNQNDMHQNHVHENEQSIQDSINQSNEAAGVNNPWPQAPSYAEVTASKPAEEESEVLSTIKPVFIEEFDIFGSKHINKRLFMKHPEMYKAISKVASARTIKGLQRVRGLWRIYVNSEYSRDNLISRGVTIRKKHVHLYSQNPRVLVRENSDDMRVRVKDIPLSADDGQIFDALEHLGCKILNSYRERLRIDGFLTDCQTGDRIITVPQTTEVLPRTLTIGKYKATLIHRGQIPPGGLKCNKCLEENTHRTYECPNDWRCRFCNEIGHRQGECEAKQLLEEDEQFTDQENDEQEQSSEETETNTNDTTEEKPQSPEKAADRVKKTGKRKTEQQKKSGESKQKTLTSYMNLTLTPNNNTDKVRIERSPVTPPDVLRAQEQKGTDKKLRQDA